MRSRALAVSRWQDLKHFIDEPEAALSPTSQVTFLRLLQQLEAGGHAQFIIATHSPILLAYPGAHIFSFDSSRVQEVAYEDTSHYNIYKQFFTDRTVFLIDLMLSDRRRMSQ